MQADQHVTESFQEFKKLFSYGSRSDLNFKFLAGLPDEEAGRFFQELLWKLGDAADDGALDRLLDLMYTWQVRGYTGESSWNYDDGPFAPLGKPLTDARLALLTSSGHFVEGDDPQPFGVANMSQDEATARSATRMWRFRWNGCGNSGRRDCSGNLRRTPIPLWGPARKHRC